MNTAVLLVVLGAALVNAQWSQGMQGRQGGMMQGPQGGMMQGRQGGMMQGSWQDQGQRMSGGRSAGGMSDGRYGGRLIDEPTMVGYEATIPGATSRYVQFRSEGGRGGRSEGGDRGQRGVDQRSGQGNQWDSGSRW